MSASGSSSSVAQQEMLPLIDCPICGKPLLTSIARRGQHPGSRYYKCVNYDDGICPFFEFQDKYARRVAQLPPAQIPHAAPLAQIPQAAPPAAMTAAHAAPAVKAANPTPPGAQHHRAATSRVAAHKPADLHGGISLVCSYQVMAAASLLIGCANLLVTIFALGVVPLMYMGSNAQ